jgi:DNA-binding transcriptional ArsR family regulator
VTKETRNGEQAIATLVKILGHPMRIRILNALSAGPKSASKLENELPDARTSVHYHLVKLEKLNVVELHATRAVRGVTEYVFRLRPRAKWGKLWEAAPLSGLPGWRGIAFRQFVEIALAAFNAGALDDWVDTTFTAGAIAVDRRGLGEVNDLFQEALKKIDRIEQSSRRRLVRNPDDEVPTVIGAAVFEAPSDHNLVPLEDPGAS